MNHARILLKADINQEGGGWTARQISESLDIGHATIERVTIPCVRNGVANLFMFFDPLTGWRHVEVTDQRTAIDYAHQMKYLVDGLYEEAVYQSGDRLVSATFPTLELTVKQVLQAGEA